jgi:hypothetical protein
MRHLLIIGVLIGAHLAVFAQAPAPINPHAQPTGTTIVLNWQHDTSSPPPLRYRIYRGTDSLGTPLLDSTASTFYVDTPATRVQTFFYRVSSIDSAGAESPSSAAVASRADGLVALYLFSGNLADSSGNGYDLTNHLSASAADRFGGADRARTYNGTTAFAERDGGFELGDQLTFTAWIKPSPSQYIYSTIVSLGDAAGDIRLGYLPFENRLTFDGWLSSIAVGIFRSNSSVPVDSWSFVSGTLQADQWKLYFNATLDSTLASPRGSYHNLNLTISKNPGPYNQDYFPGGIDDVRLYNRALSPVEIDSLFHERGWNMISTTHAPLQWSLTSIGVVPPSLLASTTLPGTIAGPFRFRDGTYRLADTLATGEGYWALYPSAGTTTVGGIAADSVVAQATVTGTGSWMLVGAPSASLPITNARINGPALFSSDFFTFSNGAYVRATSFEPGKAYWVLLQPVGGGGVVSVTIGP